MSKKGKQISRAKCQNKFSFLDMDLRKNSYVSTYVPY